MRMPGGRGAKQVAHGHMAKHGFKTDIQSPLTSEHCAVPPHWEAFRVIIRIPESSISFILEICDHLCITHLQDTLLLQKRSAKEYHHMLEIWERMAKFFKRTNFFMSLLTVDDIRRWHKDRRKEQKIGKLEKGERGAGWIRRLGLILIPYWYYV